MKQHFLSRKCDLCAFECNQRTSHAPTPHPTGCPHRDAYPLMMKTALASEKLWKLKTAANKEAGLSSVPPPLSPLVRVCLLTRLNRNVLNYVIQF